MVTDREACCAVVHGITKSQTQLSDWTELTFELVNRIKQIALPKVGVPYLINWRPEQGGALPAWLLELEHWSSPALRLELIPLALQVLSVRMEWLTGSPGSPACQQQFFGLFCFHNYMGASCVCMCMYFFFYYWFCYSRELQLIWYYTDFKFMCLLITEAFVLFLIVC